MNHPGLERSRVYRTCLLYPQYPSSSGLETLESFSMTSLSGLLRRGPNGNAPSWGTYPYHLETGGNRRLQKATIMGHKWVIWHRAQNPIVEGSIYCRKTNDHSSDVEEPRIHSVGF